ncbi:hypothetical protein DFJ67_2028 [Asanoa ferruginea]|uniref:Uncharacterized protein n=1 Tax=Asanoa ferruginea TaxID=53367 RepID=A0A3D9ZQX2_9ACTN|nr:hypothetical protein [Asanoa ferruginea]REF96060.1 hypothetical protein DFJ67_2028 [Asanoa ferruginea]GIF48078.1 hypothetical protein Afe04nite_26170 [Asanoa ferruginea]
MRPHALLLGFVALAGLSGCTESASPTVTVTYSCCVAADVETQYRPGQTMTVHWIVQTPEGPVSGPPQVELTASLAGPYASADDLKGGAAPATTYTAVPVRPAGTPDEQPVSTIVIGADAQPGYYNLVTSANQDGATAGGSSVVRVVAKS